MKPLILGVAGTAKNTGKTTTATALLAKASAEGLTVAITSIGLDGERRDQITGLGKPRLDAMPGTLVVTAEACLPHCRAVLERVHLFDIETALGRLVLARVVQGGRVLLAGPNRRRDLERVAGHLAGHAADLFLVDGALNRLVPLSGSDCLVLATGAARCVHIPTLARETELLVRLLQITPRDGGVRQAQLSAYTKDARGYSPLPYGSILSPAMADRVLESTRGALLEICLDGVLTVPAWERLIERAEPGTETALVLESPFSILAGGEILAVAAAMERWEQQGGTVWVRYSPPLRAVTINPFYPRFHARGKLFYPGFVDRNALRKALSALPLPVVDVVAEGAEPLWRAVFSGTLSTPPSPRAGAGR